MIRLPPPPSNGGGWEMNKSDKEKNKYIEEQNFQLKELTIVIRGSMLNFRRQSPLNT